jgi:hypothetical protein
VTGPYDDIINLPHHVSSTHPQMPTVNRAAQFSSFAALTGYDAAIKETGRLTKERIVLDEQAIDVLDMKLGVLTELIDDIPKVAVTYYQPDEKKEGGTYITATGAVKKIDEYERVIVLTNGARISIGDILNVECGLFEDLM